MSSLSQGPILKTRAKSLVEPGLVGRVEPIFPIFASYSTAPGAVGRFLFTAPRACRLVRIDYVADVNGAGASVVAVRKHLAGQSAAASAAVSGANIVDMVTGGIPADSTVRVATNPDVLSTVRDLAAGDKIALVTPATWVGNVTLYLVWR